jgi:hypothetical protein
MPVPEDEDIISIASPIKANLDVLMLIYAIN